MVFVLAEDFEDVNGMARQVGLTAQLLGADFIALSGDLTFAGKPIESYLIDTVDYYSAHTPGLLRARSPRHHRDRRRRAGAGLERRRRPRPTPSAA